MSSPILLCLITVFEIKLNVKDISYEVENSRNQLTLLHLQIATVMWQNGA